ncbi:MAG: Mrp/NBP35 family ATP-binding protein [Bacillota bacterium]
MYKVKENKLELEHGSINEGLIAVASGKGGVGKSTATVNLALALNKMGKKVGIIDADVRGFSIPRMIGLEEKPRALSESEMVPPEVKGIKVISMGSFVNESDPVIWRAPLLQGALQQFFQDVHWQELDYLLLDLPPGTGDMPLNILQKLPHAELVVITTPQQTATSVAGRIGKMAEKMDSEVIGVIENMSYYKCPECGNREYIFGRNGGQKLADALNTELLGQLPLVKELREVSDEGQSLQENNDSTVGQEFKKIAENLTERKIYFDPELKPMELEK